MFDAQCDLAALVYDGHDDPDAILRDFAGDLRAHGARVVGMVQSGQCADSSLSAVLVHSGETLLLAQLPSQSPTSPGATGCKLDLSRLQAAGIRVADALAEGADLVIVNRFGKRERDGKGLGFLIERALGADIPVVIAVSRASFADWIKFAGGMSVKLACDRHALDAWWRNVSLRAAARIAPDHVTVCEAFK
ncbi:DUF2478 domain-containing protein [Bradyrhizobium elkanii]|uniref:DUF2478 domain-containing protein n=1 Tax=Bradyrhizobium elkanii TaxID=29448 RepID=UPI001BAB276C|nr:DUF2478 domain-containing protein [Bradyrhizobium elkanii]MBR1162775.1 DUF2478 domain-containing protein [Bradyrhizobium elkanii]